MKKALLKDSFVEIKKSFKRFLSILVMALLGVGFFSGLRASSPDMQATLDAFYDNQEVYDLEIISTLGFTNDDIEVLKNIDGVENVKASYDEDVFVENKSGDKDIIKVIELTDEYNKPVLIEGRFPEKENECVIDSRMANFGSYKIGDKITLEEKLEEKVNDDDEDEKPTFRENNLEIVGIVGSPLYLSTIRGTTTLGDGTLDYYIYVLKSNIDSDIYTKMYLTVKDAKELDAIENEYSELVGIVKEKLEKIKPERETHRYNEVIGEANEKLADAENTLATEKADAEKKIKDAEKELVDAKKELADGEKEAKEGREKADKEITDATGKLAEAETQVIKGQEELDRQKVLFEDKKKEAASGIEQIKNGIKQISISILDLDSNKALLDSQTGGENVVITGIQTITENINAINSIIDTLPPDEQVNNQLVLQGLQANLAELNEAKAGYDAINQGYIVANSKKQELESQINSINAQLLDGEAKLYSSQLQLNSAWDEIQANKIKLEETKQDTYKKLDEADTKIKDAKKKIVDGEKELLDKKQEFEEKIADAEQKLFDARQKLEDIKNAKWIISDRDDLDGFSSYKENIKSISKIAIVFPITFFIIAALISLTSMSRMVEEERTQIGTLKALGYNKYEIVEKYVIYASLASLIGGIIGVSFGFQFFPRVIIFLYEMMFIHMTPVVTFSIKYAILGNGIMLFCMVGTTIYTAFKDLTLVPAELMRPKSPKVGKRVLLEHIPFIWNRLNFTKKVTIRNMFRYKKRFMMTIIGIAGCTALIVAGFGLKDSISYVLDAQYEKVYHFNMILALNDTISDDEIIKLEDELKQKEEINATSRIYSETATISLNDVKEDVTIVAVDNLEEFDSLITLNDMHNKKSEIHLDDNTIIITDKLGDLLKFNDGDIVKILDNDKEEYDVKIDKQVEHYVSHYIYMTKAKYQEIFGKECSPNVIYVQYKFDMEKNKEDEFAENLLKDTRILSVVLSSSMKENINTILKSLNLVVYVLIVSAGLLAFVVLYNLANVNISERVRELATIKVLGFYDKEVYDYIVRETKFLTVIGIIIGLVAGFILTGFILITCEVNMLRFPIHVKPITFVYSSLITIIFTIIVNDLTYFALKKIDMIESLKSIE